jgi:GntR family transcriptional regulator
LTPLSRGGNNAPDLSVQNLTLPDRTPIDRSSPVPFDHQVAETIEDEIVSGRCSLGTRLPSEPETARHFGVSPSTVRQALSRLEQKGLIVRRQGEGTFVDAGRVRSGDERVALYVVNYLPARLADGVGDIGHQPDGSLYARLAERYGLRVAGAQRWLEAVTAGERLCALLEVAPASPLAFIESVSWDHDLAPFDCYPAFVRTDRMRIEISVASATVASSFSDEGRI